MNTLKQITYGACVAAALLAVTWVAKVDPKIAVGAGSAAIAALNEALRKARGEDMNLAAAAATGAPGIIGALGLSLAA